MTDEETLHGITADQIRAEDKFYLNEIDLATVLTQATIATHPDGRQQIVFMVEVPLTHKFDTIIRGRE